MTKNLIVSRLDEAVYATLKENVDTVEELKYYMKDVYTHGCISGTVPQLIYVKDCEYFVKEHLSDILVLFDEAVDEGIVEAMPTNISLIAWWAFEITCKQLYEAINWEAMLERTIEAEIDEE